MNRFSLSDLFLQHTHLQHAQKSTGFLSGNTMVKVALLVAAMSSSLFLTACPGPDWPKCENDEHCKEKEGNALNYHCVFGQCQECGRDADCAANQQCNKKTFRCEIKCSDDASCDSGFMCESGGCVKGERASEIDENACVETGDCQSGMVCKEGTCAEDVSGGGAEGGAEPVISAVECEKAGKIQFGFNTFDLSPEARESLKTFAKCMEEHADWEVVIEGYADERGTSEYNLSLGEKRSREVKKYMSRLGIDGKRMRPLSYGEEKPIAEGSSEEAWAANRRAEFRVKE